MNKHMKDISGKTKAELIALLAEMRESQRTLRFASAGARPQDASQGKKLKSDIARVLTRLSANAS